MPLQLKNKYDIGQMVHIVTDPDKLKYMIIFIQVNPNGLLYGLSFNGESSLHFEIEIEPVE